MTSSKDSFSPTSGYSLRGVQGRIIEVLGREILSGKYEPGELLPREYELMEKYDVSRTSLREAMKVLAAKGLVETKQKSGTRVRPTQSWNAFDGDLFAWSIEEGGSDRTLHDLMELRQLLEPSAARLAASRATMTDTKRINDALEQMTLSARAPEEYASHDVAFHLAVFGASQNAFLQYFGNLVGDFLRRSFDIQQKAMLDQSQAQDFSEDVKLHRAVFECIHRGEAEAAEHAMLELVLDGKRNLIAAVVGQ